LEFSRIHEAAKVLIQCDLLEECVDPASAR
jgi:hypothetical protein